MPPVLINNWEATYFDFDEDKLLKIASTAAEIGVETFVLDDGWFENRNDDKSGLGDWNIDYNKLPNGVKGLSDKLDAIGMKLGLWVEPESVSEISTVYQLHPEWVIQTPGRNKTLGRNQYLLDYTNPDVVDYIYNKLSKIYDGANITYVKWDMNRNITEPYSKTLQAHRQGEFMHRYILGLYSLLDKLTKKFPEMIIESCAGGGGRFDPGMLYYAPLAWTSDNTDAIARLQIQKGTSLCYPLRSMGCHVSMAPNHQVGRYTKLQTRIDVASFGAYGFQLDINKMNEEDVTRIKESILRYKEMRELIQFGQFHRLETESGDNMTAWMMTSKDKTIAVVGIYQALAIANPPKSIIRLQGLLPEKIYKNVLTDTQHGGDELMYRGLTFNDAGHYYVNEDALLATNQVGAGDFTSEVIILQA